MVGKGSVQIVGARRLRATMKRAGVDLGQMSAAHQQVGSIVIAASSPLAPRKSGRLATSLKATRTRASAVVKSNVIYAGVQEYGWPARNIAASAFVRGGAKNSEPVWLSTYLDAINKALKQVKGA